jgi:hypothetical protein
LPFIAEYCVIDTGFTRRSLKLRRPGNNGGHTPGNTGSHPVVTLHQTQRIRIMNKTGEMAALEQRDEFRPVPDVEFNIRESGSVLPEAMLIRGQNELGIAQIG